MKVSVVITSFNYGHFLNDSIESVLEQTFDSKEIEIIVVNDGSTDNTVEIATNYPVKLINQPNLGVPLARNNGIRISRGEFILPLDADDKLAPQYLEKTVPIIEKSSDVAVVYTHRCHFGLTNSINYSQVFDLEKIRKKNQLNYCSLFRKSVWLEVGGYNPIMNLGCEDWDFWLSIAEANWRFELIDEVLFYYRKHGYSLTDVAIRHFDFIINQIYDNHPKLYSKTIPTEHKNGISYFTSK